MVVVPTKVVSDSDSVIVIYGDIVAVGSAVLVLTQLELAFFVSLSLSRNASPAAYTEALALPTLSNESFTIAFFSCHSMLQKSHQSV